MVRIFYGVTGTRDGSTKAQRATMLARFWHLTEAVERRGHEPWLVHGACPAGGIDVEVHQICKGYGWKVWILPGPTGPHEVCLDADAADEPRPFLERNRLVVDRSHALTAVPRGFTEEQRSGTWATMRYASKVGKRTGIIWPDGRFQSYGEGDRIRCT